MAEQKIEKRRHNTNKQDKVNYAISEREDRAALGCTGLYWAILGRVVHVVQVVM